MYQISGFQAFLVFAIIGYAVAFFALDAFGWMFLTSVISVKITTDIVTIIAIYSLVIFTGITYFLDEKNNMVN